MQSEVMFAGFGGQGILMCGKVLAHAALEEGHEVVWIPSYGPEMRGGTAYCLVIISDKPIGSPVVRNPSHLVALNQPSLEKFAPVIKPAGIILINSSLIFLGTNREDVDVIKIPVTSIAKGLGSVRAANVVALGAFVARSKIVEFDTLRHCTHEEFINKKSFLDLNMNALEEGKKAVECFIQNEIAVNYH
jgi:2-oxoglutarate ferredoxin oxidoreductase subunit gamma